MFGYSTYNIPNVRIKNFNLKSDFIFYFSIFWPFFAQIIYSIWSFNSIPITYICGLYLLLVSILDGKIFKPLNAIFITSIFFILSLFAVKLIVQSFDLIIIVKLLSNVGIAAYFIKFSIPNFKTFAIASSIFVFITFYIFRIASGTVSGNSGIGFSYHDTGLYIVILWTMTILKNNREVDLNINLLFLFLVLLLMGRTQIFMALFIFIFTIMNKISRQNLRSKFFIFLSVIPLILTITILPSQTLNFLSNFYFLNDFLSRGASVVFEIDANDMNLFDENLRLFIWNCYIINFDYSTLLYGHNNEIAGCVRDVWLSAYPDKSQIQYENSFIRLNQESGFAVFFFILLFFISLLSALIKKDFFLFGLLILFLVRAFTGDIFFFYYKDFILLILFSYAIYEKNSVYNNEYLKHI